MLFLLGFFGSLDKSQYPSSKGIRSLRRAQPTQLIGGSRFKERLIDDGLRTRLQPAHQRLAHLQFAAHGGSLTTACRWVGAGTHFGVTVTTGSPPVAEASSADTSNVRPLATSTGVAIDGTSDVTVARSTRTTGSPASTESPWLKAG